MGVRTGVDSGGTFTDVVGADGRTAKVLSTPDDPSRAVAGALAALTDEPVGELAHGTTVATNALLERKGGRVALVTNEGMTDVIEIARQDRPSLYDHRVDRPEPLVDRIDRHGVGGRLDATGAEVDAVDLSDLPVLGDGVDAVAVVLLHSDLDPRHEQAVATRLREAGHDVTASHEVSPEFREYERTVTTVLNAYLRPRCRSYLHRVDGLAARVRVMTSGGGLVDVAEAADRPVELLLSGPAGGVRAGAAAAVACGFSDAVTFDMGGTSTDVCLILGGEPSPAAGRRVAGLPVRTPSLDIHTIGAGGGSIARIDPGGALVVGPESAGADPGPACYGRGGVAPTVTDADLVLGRIPDGASFGPLSLDRGAAEVALAAAGTDADGVVAVVDAHMVEAVRSVTVARGVDPSGLALVAFGGAGPLHACAIAEALDMAAVVVPARAGVLSAVGLLTSPLQREVVRSWGTPDDVTGVAEALEDLMSTVAGLVGGVGEAVQVAASVDCRYPGQSHELTVAEPADFHEEHHRRNGFSEPASPVEVVALRARAWTPAPLTMADLPDVPRTEGDGPIVLAEPDCTVWVPGGWRARRGPASSLLLERT